MFCVTELFDCLPRVFEGTELCSHQGVISGRAGGGE